MNRLRGQRGVSLLEVLAGITLFSVVAAGLGVTTVGSISANRATKDVVAATALLHDKVEQLRALDSGTNPTDLAAGAHSEPGPIGPLGESGGRFSRSWSVIPNSPKVNVSTVVVVVSWGGPQAGSIRGVTYVCTSGTCS